MMHKNERKAGFKVLDIIDIDECGCKGIWLKHERTGLELFHMLNDDEENLFAFSFRTPANDSTGAAHVLEHSVLCGSEKYPVNNPFITLANQSVKTYLNAYTASDRTCYPASTTVKADYFNLMSVYGDAVFFPLLKPEIFMQEAHRLERDEKGNASIQGVVYNEMKGSYSSFNDVAYENISNIMLAGTNYAFDSGGDPQFIPELTLNKLKAFHNKYYCPANCMLFLYGNISTEEQLDFINNTFLKRIKNTGRKVVFKRNLQNTLPKSFVHCYGPLEESNNDDSKSKNDSSQKKATCTTLLSFNTTELDKNGFPSFTKKMELCFLDELLSGDDSAPLIKALLNSGLGEDIAPQTYAVTSIRESYYSCGMRGVEEKNARKIKKIILETLNGLVKNGVSKEDLNRTCMSFDFENREIKRAGGPYSLVYLRRCLNSWTYGDLPWNSLFVRKEVDSIKHKIQTVPGYIESLIKNYFIDNKKQSLIVMSPSKTWSNKRIKVEKDKIKELTKKENLKKTLLQIEKMHQYQNLGSLNTDKYIPHLKPSDLNVNPEKIITKISTVEGITCFTHNYNTNGVTYISIAFPVDVLSPEEYPMVPILSNVLTQLGWAGKSWEESLQLAGQTTGLLASLCRCVSLYNPSKKENIKKWQDREWIEIVFKVLDEKTEEALDLVSDCIQYTQFNDTKRLQSILNNIYNNDKSCVVQSGHSLATLRSLRKTSRCAAISEIWHGISSIITDKKICSSNMTTVAKHLSRIFSEIKKGGTIINITSDKQGLNHVNKLLPSFIQKTKLLPLTEKHKFSNDKLYELTEIPNSMCKINKSINQTKLDEQNEVFIDECFIIPGTVGYAATAINNAEFNTKESTADGVYSHALENTILWEEIRTKGGAYGVMVSTDSTNEKTSLVTYRDPDPYRSLVIFKNTLSNPSAIKITKELVEKTVTGTYSEKVEPKTPFNKGSIGFIWELGGMTNSIRIQSIKRLISIKEKDLIASAKRYKQQIPSIVNVVFCTESQINTKLKNNTGKIVELPL